MTRYCLTAALVFAASASPAADWPQFQGPDRNNVSRDTGLLKAWPSGGPKLLWTSPDCGLGYSGPAVVGDRLYCMGSEEGKDKEFVFALDVTTGKQVWRTPIAALRKDKNFTDQYGGGPRCTPTVAGEALYVLGAQGDVACLETATGKLRWEKNLVKDFDGKLMTPGVWGYSESPLVDGDKLICCPGGEKGTVAALDKKTGDLLWRSKDLTDDAAYSSAVVAEVAGGRQYVVHTGKGVAGVAAADGKLLWRQEGKNYRTAVIPTPIVHGDLVYATTDYGGGCMLIKLTPSGQGIKAELVYRNKVMDNHHGGVVLIGGHVFGSNGNAMTKPKLPFVCQDLMTGNAVWQETLEPSSVVLADGFIYCYGQETGTVVRVRASAAKFEEAGRFTIPKASAQHAPKGAIWTHPVIANGHLYLRDQELLYCYDLREQRAAR
jgi:outer membrane protein assembly factor BamB